VKAALQWAMLAGALALLNASLTFDNVWPTLSVHLSAALSIEVALCVLAIIVAARWFRTPSPAAVQILAAIWVFLVIGRYEDVTARSLYGRDINLYWDLRNLPSVGAMLSFVAKPWLVAATIAGVALVPLIIYLPLRWALGCVTNASKDPRVRKALTAVAGGVLVGLFWVSVCSTGTGYVSRRIARSVPGETPAPAAGASGGSSPGASA